MDFSKTIELSEKYLREFVLYLVSFFRGREEEHDDNLALNDMNRSVLFAIMSAVLGAYLWDVLILEKHGVDEDIGVILAETLMRWLSLGLVLYFLMRVLGVKVHIILPILAVFRVFAISRIAGVYAAYLVDSLLYGAPIIEQTNRAAISAPFAIAYVVQLMILWVYFWRETAGFVQEGDAVGRRYLATFLFLVVVTIVVLIPISEYMCNFVLEC